MNEESTNKRILLVDDDRYLQRLLGMLLSRTGYEVVMAGHGKEALDILQNQSPDQSFDLIVLDLMMPVMDGFHFLKWLREEARSNIPVLSLTGMQKADTAQKLLAAGASAVLFKPVNVEELMAQIGTLLGDN